MKDLFTCRKCGDEYGAGEDDRGRSPCCLAELDPQGSICDGCYKDPCVCLPDDCNCDPS